MTKASSPVRLQEDLMRAAGVAGELAHRSAAKQVEYWAYIGRKLSGILDPATLLDVKAGLSRLRVEEVKPVNVDMDEVFANLDRKREDGSLSAAVVGDSVYYQASRSHPGQLEQVSPDGSVQVGKFVNGEFVPDGLA